MDFTAVQRDFLEGLLVGNRLSCSNIINDLVKDKVGINDIYENLIRVALYEVGELWERGEISVASEHMASAIVESILNELYSTIISKSRMNNTVVASSVENEAHQIGIKMVADVFEMHGWNVHFLGANTPLKDLIRFIEIVNPKIVALSMSIYFHIHLLEEVINRIRDLFPETLIIVGGQGLRLHQKEITGKYPNLLYFPDLFKLEEFIKSIEYNG
ncbi:MAG: cobalamin-binding protein [Bacteroidetes bacterium HGW-Bacteroidetes-5]|jgi:methanogenic corrinoid protein MtbC1|nr:MAG: cobalamin-binding protein [Bacteroidetes bacterium HGW-Bacteroidetes-5]